jgi:transposase
MARMGSSKTGRRARRQFTEEFRTGAVRLVLDEGKTVGAVARELDLTPSSLAKWASQARADRSHGKTGLTTAEREELARLRKENRILQEERDILKKWSWATAHPRRDESGRVHGAMRPGKGRRLLVPSSPEKNGPECCAPGTPHCCPPPNKG